MLFFLLVGVTGIRMTSKSLNNGQMHLLYITAYVMLFFALRGYISASRQEVGEFYSSWLHKIDSVYTCLWRETLISTKSAETMHHAYSGLL